MEKQLPKPKGRNSGVTCLVLFLLAFAPTANLFAQSKVVTGNVKASDDETGLPGARIMIKGTTEGTTTDEDGNFSLSVPADAVLMVSSIGYASQEISVGNQTVINIVLAADVLSLQEVVVIGYGTQDRKDLTGSISSVTAAQIEKVPVNTIDQAIQGRSPGVLVTNNDGSPGGSVSIKIRGTGSFGDNSPLYVVDGYPISGGLNNINPNDIATMDILKDASATAIYGSRASNGVVIITTKRGKKDGLQVTFDANTMVQKIPKTYDVLNAQEFATFATEVANEVAYPVLPEWSNPSSLRNIDWQDEVYQTGVRQSYNLGIRGGNDKVSSAFSVGYLDHKGVVLLSDYQRYNVAVNVDMTPFKWLKASTSLKYSRNDGDTRFGTGQNGIGRLTKLAPTMSGNPATDRVKDGNGNYGYYTRNSSAVGGMSNVVRDIETQDRQRLSNNLLGSASLEAEVIKGLKLKTNVGISTSDNSGYYFTPTFFTVADTTQNYLSQNSNNSFEWLWENTVAYSKEIGVHNFDFVGGISSQENTYRQIGTGGNGSVSDELRDVGGITTITSNFGNQQSWSLYSQFARLTYKLKDRYILTATVRRDGSSRFAEGNRFGTFPSFSAAWRVKEESFLQPVEIISEFKLRGSWGQSGNQNIGMFKYQGTYGPGPSQTDNRDYVFGREKRFATGLILQALPNPRLTWETTTQADIGFDLGLLDNRFNVTFDYYNRKSEDFLLDIQVPVQTGYPTATRNVGSIRNSGLELALDYRETRDDFRWGVNANITTVNNKILSFADGLKSQGNFSTLGFPTYGSNTWLVFSQSNVGGEVGAFYGFQSNGILQSQPEIDALNANAAAINGAGISYISAITAPGDRNFVDQITVDTDGDKIPDARDGRITDDDRVIIGSPIPDWFGGLNIDAGYKNFDVSVFFFGVFGNEILNYAKRDLESLAPNGGVGVQNVGRDFYRNRWTPENPSNEYPRAVREDVTGNGRVSDAFVEDGSFVRLRNVQIGYTLPQALTRGVINKARFYVSAQNLFTITKYSGLDPEIGEVPDQNGNRSVTANGIDLGNYPNPRGLTFGVNLQF